MIQNALFELEDFNGLNIERTFWKRGLSTVVGVDEAGRGALAGPVVAAACVLSERNSNFIGRIKDSKKLKPQTRDALYTEIIENCVAYGIGIVHASEIDKINILQATLLAMSLAIKQIQTHIDVCLIDGDQAPCVPHEVMTVIQGDDRVLSISAASILAKVTRDRWMQKEHEHHPQYGFDEHKGYGTKKHFQQIESLGLSDIHRKSFSISRKEQPKHGSLL